MQVRRNTTIANVLLMSLAIAFAGCGGGSTPSPPPPVTVVPQLASLSPMSAIVGGASFTLTVNGSNLTPSEHVLWNNQPVLTAFVSSQQVTAEIPASLIVSTGVISISVLNASSIASNALQFSINNPVPQIATVSPDNVMAGAAPVRLTVSGSNFVPGATLLLDGKPQPTVQLAATSATQLQTTISATDLAAARSVSVTIANPQPAAGPSNPITFTVTPFTSNPAPTLTSASDASVPAGWPGFQLTVHGTNFVAASTLQWNGVNRTTTVLSGTQLQAAIPADQLASPGAAQFSVLNPSPGGGISGSLPIQIQAVSPNAIGVIERSDIADDLSEENGGTQSAAVSGDGRFVAFLSGASNLVPNTPDTNGEPNLFLRDTCLGAPAGCMPSLTLLPNSSTFLNPALSSNGRFVGLSSGSSISLYDTCFGAPVGCVPGTQPISTPPNTDLSQASLSADGRFAVFLSGLYSSDCSPWDYGCNPPEAQTFLADSCAGVSSACTPSAQAIAPASDPFLQAPDGVVLLQPSISPDGRFVAFNTSSRDISLYDSCQGAPPGCSPSTALVSVATNGGPADADGFGGAVSSGGRYVAFVSSASNLVSGIGAPGVFRVYLRDMCTGARLGCTSATTLIAVAGDGSPFVDPPSLSADGRYIAFTSGDTNLVTGDTNGVADIFVRDTCAGISSGCTPSTVRVSVALDGTQGNADSFRPAISADGRYVVFISHAKLAPGMPNNLGGGVYLARH